MATGIIDQKGIQFYKDENLNIYYRDGLLTKRQTGKAQEDIGIGKKVTFSWVIRKAEEWIENYELENI